MPMIAISSFSIRSEGSGEIERLEVGVRTDSGEEVPVTPRKGAISED
jgi:hypothetical protein